MVNGEKSYRLQATSCKPDKKLEVKGLMLKINLNSPCSPVPLRPCGSTYAKPNQKSEFKNQ
jgi:hypothetical protein